MREIVVIVVLHSLPLAALATHIEYQRYKAALMHKAPLHSAPLIQFVFEAADSFSCRRVNKAPVYEFEYRIVQLCGVSLDIQVKQRIIVVQLVQLNSQLIHI